MTKTRDLANLIADSKVGPTEIDTSGTYTLGGIAATGDLTLDAAGDIILDADGADIKFADGGSTFMEIKHESSSIDFLLNTTNDDFKFKGSDDGSSITALTLDMSEGGAATFNSGATFGGSGNVKINNGNLQIKTTGQIEDNGTRLLLRSTGDASGLRFDGGNYTPFKNGSEANGTVDLGYSGAKFKDLYLSGTAFAYRMKVSTASSGASADASADELVVESNGNAGISILSGQSNVGSIYFGDAGVNWDGYIAYSQANRTMTLGTAAGAGSVNINSSGNVLIGTTTSLGKFAVKIDTNKNIAYSGGIGEVGNVPALYACNDAGSSLESLGFRGTDLRFATQTSERMRIDSTGNVGIAKTSLATWSSGYNALQVGGRGFVGAHSSSDLYLGQNASFNSGWKYEASVAASMTQHSGGKITHFVAPAGTAGNAISWNTAMDITADGTTTLAGTYASTNSVNYVLRLQSSSSGSAVAGHGTGIQFLGERNDGNAQSLALIQAVTLTNSGTSIAAGLHFYTGSGGAPSERMSITSAGQFVMPGVYTDTTSDAANINVRSDGLHRRNTSSLRYKNTINDATHGLTELLALRPVTYKGNNDGDTVFGGLIAEEVHDAGLTEFVDYDSQNRPDALRYPHMISLCVKAIQEQQEVIESLTARITALEA